MKNVIDILKGLGIEVPADKTDDLNKQVSENYKTISEFEKKLGKAESERDGLKEQLETAKNTLKGFDGVDLATIQADLEKYKQQAENAEKDFKDKLYQRDFDDALKAKLDGVKFSSEAARRAVTAEIREAGLKLVNGEIMGLGDLLGQIQEKDASAFVDEQQEQLENGKARFTDKLNNGGSGQKKYASWREVMDIKDATERQAAIAANQNLFTEKE